MNKDKVNKGINMITFRISLVFLAGFLIGAVILLSFPSPLRWAGLVIGPVIAVLAAAVADKIILE